MSREFGEGPGGFFHEKIRDAAEDTEHGAHPFTRLLGEHLAVLADIAYAVSSFEACDWGEASFVNRLIERLPDAQQTLLAFEGALGPWIEVAEDAAYEHYTASLDNPVEVESGKWALKVPLDYDAPTHKREMRERMRNRFVREAAGKAVSRVSSSLRAGDGHSTEHYNTWDHPHAGLMGLRAQIREMEKKFAGYEAWSRTVKEKEQK